MQKLIRVFLIYQFAGLHNQMQVLGQYQGGVIRRVDNTHTHDAVTTKYAGSSTLAIEEMACSE